MGDFVEVDLLEGQRKTVTLRIAARVEDYFGIKGMMDLVASSTPAEDISVKKRNARSGKHPPTWPKGKKYG